MASSCISDDRQGGRTRWWGIFNTFIDRLYLFLSLFFVLLQSFVNSYVRHCGSIRESCFPTLGNVWWVFYYGGWTHFFPSTWTSIRINSCDVIIDMFWLSDSQTEILYVESGCEFYVSCVGMPDLWGDNSSVDFYYLCFLVSKCLVRRCDVSLVMRWRSQGS